MQSGTIMQSGNAPGREAVKPSEPKPIMEIPAVPERRTRGNSMIIRQGRRQVRLDARNVVRSGTIIRFRIA